MNGFAREESVSAMLVGEFGNDRLLLHDIFRNLGWRLLEAHKRREGMRCLGCSLVQVVVAERDSPHWNWRKILSDFRRLVKPPLLIVTSRLADDALWSEALNLGAHDVLAQPFDRNEVERVMASACRRFKFQPELARPRVHAANVA
jgi:DNA-binding response OmpR family regulator